MCFTVDQRIVSVLGVATLQDCKLLRAIARVVDEWMRNRVSVHSLVQPDRLPPSILPIHMYVRTYVRTYV